jgi:hypothetical protein
MQVKTEGFNAVDQIKDLSNTAINQAKYIADEVKSNAKELFSNSCNVLAFQKKSIQQNPFNSMTFYWQIAQMRKNFVFWSTLPFVIGETFWTTWRQVYAPEGKK